ncbi:hypothetical protein A6A29_39975 [Streptomyces sp. TSRI0281]|nr:hypothetical protein A6A29_39975 [Streptomyces sp. TSRI0281]
MVSEGLVDQLVTMGLSTVAMPGSSSSAGLGSSSVVDDVPELCAAVALRGLGVDADARDGGAGELDGVLGGADVPNHYGDLVRVSLGEARPAGLLTIRVPVAKSGDSLGRKWVKDGPQGAAVGNVVHIQLKFTKGHAKPRTWVVYTAYPE